MRHKRVMNSSWVTRPPADAPGALVVHVHGDDDDALRIAAELADGLGEPHDAAAVCLTPGSPWRDREAAVRGLLDAREKNPRRRMLVLVDVDALPVEVGERWDDRTFAVPRRRMRELLLAHVTATGNALLVRTRPDPRLTDELATAGIRATEADDVIADLVPAIRPLARALVDRGVVGEHALRHWIHTLDTEPLTRLVLDAAYDALPVPARDALDRLAVLRGPQPLNGVAGPFTLGGSDALGLERAAVDAVREWGWLHPAPGGFYLPALLREHVEPRARLACDLAVLHHEIAVRAAPSIDTRPVPQSVEIHRHAVESGDVTLAASTARHFANDLRRLAFDLGTRAGKRADAAAVYRRIVELDDQDAYAHEYLAYNLDQHAQRSMAPRAPSDEILAHYETAKRLEPENPLFVGRWLACRARRGENVAPELRRYVVRFNRSSGVSAVSYLARTPLQQMSPEQRKEVARDEVRWILERDADLRALL